MVIIIVVIVTRTIWRLITCTDRMPCSERRVHWPRHLSLCECCADGDSCSTQAPRGTSNSHATRVCQRILFTSLLPVAHYSRQYAHGNKHEKQTPKAWVRWFHIFLFFEAATRTAYFILEGVVPWKPPGKEDPRILLWEATLLWVATPCLFCCYIVVLGKWLGFLREISSQSNPASTRLSVNGVQGKKGKSFNWTACISVVIFVAYVATLALAYFAIFGASSDLQHKLYDIANSITDYVWEHLHNGTTFYLFCQNVSLQKQITVVIYLALAIGYGSYAMRTANAFHSNTMMGAALSLVLRRVVSLSAVLSVCFTLRPVLMVVMAKVLSLWDHEWVIFPYFILTDLLPQVLTVVLFVKNQKTVQLARQRRTFRIFG